MEESAKKGPKRMGRREVLIGLAILSAIVVFNVAAAQLTTNFVRETNAPFFFISYSTIFLIFCFPGYALIVILRNVLQSRPLSFGLSHSLSLFGPGTKLCSLGPLVRRVLPLTLIYVASNYLFALSLKTLSNTEVSATMAAESMLVYILSFVFLGTKMMGLAVNIQHVISSILAVGGIICVSMSSLPSNPCLRAIDNRSIILPIGLKNSSNDEIFVDCADSQSFAFSLQKVLAFIPACFAAFGAGIYKVLFKRVMKSPSAGQVSLFVSMMGVMSIILCVPVCGYLIISETEQLPATGTGWLLAILSALLGLCFNWLVNYGVSVTFPLFIAIGYSLHVPINAIVDRIMREDDFGALKISGVVCSFLAIILISIPLEPKTRQNFGFEEPKSASEEKFADRDTIPYDSSYDERKICSPDSNLTDSLIRRESLN